MTIIKKLTNIAGIVYEYHKVTSINIDAQDNVTAVVSSWINKDKSTDKDRPVDRFVFQIHTPITTGLVTTAETLLVADPACKLYGGTITQDVILTDLEESKVKKRLEVTSAKNVEMYSPKTTSLGVFDNTDADNNKLSIVIQVTQLAEARGAPAVAGFKNSDGVWSEYTLAQLETIALEMAAQVIPLYTKESTLMAQIDAATTIDQVNAITW